MEGSGRIDLQRFIDASPSATIVVAGDGAICAANSVAAALFGWTVPQLVAMEVEDLLPERLRAAHRAHRQRFDGHKRPMGTRLQLYGLRADGTEFPADISLGPMDDGQILTTIIDITRQREAEQELQSSKARLEAALASMSDAVLITDDRGHVIAWNDACVTYHRFEDRSVCLVTPEQYFALIEIRQPGGEPVVPDDWAVQRALRGEAGVAVEYGLRRKDTGERWIGSYSFAPVRDKSGRIDGAVVSARDVTEARRTQQAMQSMTAEMEAMLRFHVVRQTLAAMTHELNQPLMSLATHSEAALRLLDAGNPRPERLRDALKTNVAQAQRAGRVIRDLHAFINRRDAKSEPVDVRALVNHVLLRVGSEFDSSVRYETSFEPDLPPVHGNRLQLEKVLSNLVENSLDAMREAGSATPAVTITARRFPEANALCISVADQGPGISPEAAARIFEPFYTTKAKGLGVGLAISREIVESHGGRLWTEPRCGDGACFFMTLPFAGADDPAC